MQHLTDEGGKGVDNQAGAQHDQQVCLPKILGHPLPEAGGQVLSKEHDVRFDQAAAALHVW
jgi:hypothetical protein